ncbi:circadian clock protein KaiC [Legionella israelensis]|uniref:non-specific serine/threonine protein kinase n=1 Tax=Legionella israelensis TaxID=454 RepID=A0AAX1EI36_9GAMM|nr:circadian clock protein KaiC [Legionella israelensis]QBR84775.1 circadian clock protein KaiC [Legionella israelensis]
MAIEKTTTGISGLDNILYGGYLKSKPTLIKGAAGTGKTLFTLFFAAAQIKEKGAVVYASCDEPPEQIIAYMDRFGLEGSKLQETGKLLILDFTPSLEDEISGEFNISAFLLRIEQAIKKTKANTLIIDSLQSLLLGLPHYDPHTELLSLYRWTRHKKLTTLTTIADIKTILNADLYEEYVVDCAIQLKQTIKNNLMTRYLRVIKFRGTAHGTNEYPFSIIDNGISLIPITETRLDVTVSTNYLSTGIKGLDRMLDDKGYQEGAPIMISGRSGTAKTLFAASFAKSCLHQGKKVLFVSFEESPSHLIHHFISVDIDLRPFLEDETLAINARRSVEMGLENHIISIIEMNQRHEFDVIIVDPISSLLDLGDVMDVKMMFVRFISYMKARKNTLLFTELLPDYAEEHSLLGLSSLTDTWIRLSYIEKNGEFNRLMYISKSRGIKTSNQVKEFLVTDEGIIVEDPYIGDEEMVFGSRKAARILEDKQQETQNAQEIAQLESEIKAVEEELVAHQKVQIAEYQARKNALLRQKNKLVNEEKQMQARRQANKLLRE